MISNARKTTNMPALVSKIANKEIAAQVGAMAAIGLGWVCLYLAVTQTWLME
jgi:hypothetical protein